jgi:LmbE family N-acetylglucosaminyl deacetylase
MLYLAGRDATSSLDAIATVATDLREQGVKGRALDHNVARQIIRAMEDLLVSPDSIPGHVDDLKTFAATAAAWADAAPSPSAELRAAVALRRAAGELRTQALSPSAVHLMRARRYLSVATDALDQRGAGAGGPGPGLAVDGIRDRLENLQQSQQERYQEVDEELKQ